MSQHRRKFAPVNTIVDVLTADRLEPDWLIPNLLLQGSVVCLAGEPASGKSYVSYTLGLAIASGSPALSGIVPTGEPRRVLYFDEENGEQDRTTYLQRSWVGLAYANQREPDLGALYENFWSVPFHLGGDDWSERAEEWIDYVKPHLIVFDTATPAFNIHEENENSEASQAIRELRRLITIPDPTATALILKHANSRADKGGRRTLRGAKAWRGSADGILFMVRPAGRPRKDGLALTKLEPDKIRAWGLLQTLYISPKWTDNTRSGLALEGSYSASQAHKKVDREEDRQIEKESRSRQ